MVDIQAAPVTKSQFKLGLGCIQKLRHARNRLAQSSQENDMLRLLAEGGAAVEALVRATEPGLLIGDFGQGALDRSREAIRRAFADARTGKTTPLYEVTISHDGFLARLDLLRIGPDCIELVEIKAKGAASIDGGVPDIEFLTKVDKKGAVRVRASWLGYIQDLAFQRALLTQWLAVLGASLNTPGIRAVHAKLLLINTLGTATPATMLCRENYQSDYTPGSRGVRATVKFNGPNSDRALLVEVLMDRVVAVVDANAGSRVPEFENLSILDCMMVMKSIVESDSWADPHVALSQRCRKCEFCVSTGPESGFERCWGPPSMRPAHHVLTLSYLTGKQCASALAKGGRNAAVLDIDETLIQAQQRMHYRSLTAGCPIVAQSFADDPRGKMKVATDDGPIYFIDFETSAYPIPSRGGGRPYEHIPFQFEGHRLASPNSGLETRERLPGFLELENPNPRRAFIDAMHAQFGESGPIFHWHQFERDRLKEIKAELTTSNLVGDDARVGFIDSLIGPTGDGGGRLVDLLLIAKAAFYHPDMGGSYSIKKVLPIAWAIKAIRDHFTAGHSAVGDPDIYAGDTDPYDELPAPPISILEALGGVDVVTRLIGADESDGGNEALRNGGMAMLAYHYVRMFGRADDPAIVGQFRQYCRLDSAAMVMVYAMMRDHVRNWKLDV